MPLFVAPELLLLEPTFEEVSLAFKESLVSMALICYLFILASLHQAFLFQLLVAQLFNLTAQH